MLKPLLFLLYRLRMEPGEDVSCKTGTTFGDAWSQVELQEFAGKAVEEKAYFFRKHLHD